MKTEEMINNMEFLMKELHKEWERSGVDIRIETIKREDSPQIIENIKFETLKKQRILDNTESGFKRIVKETKETYVWLRIAKKIMKEFKKKVKDEDSVDIAIALDKEEWKLYRSYFDKKKD